MSVAAADAIMGVFGLRRSDGVLLSLPFPPSANRLWRHWQGRTLLSREGRQYREQVAREWLAARAQGFGRAKLRVSIVAWMPDARRRDLDNLLKASGDAMMRAGAFADDSQIVRLCIERGGIDRTNPRLDVLLEAA